MILDWFQLSDVEWILLGALLLVFLIQLFYYLYYYQGLKRKSGKIDKGLIAFETEKKPVTIVICARDHANCLAQNLPSILEQDYPEFQVVVVNDASSDDTENVLVGLAQKYPHLYHTFVPVGVQSVSSKKMAMTIGIKAAKYDLLLFTEPNSVPNSNQWISSMMRHFNEKCEIVLGFSTYQNVKGLCKYLISYDTLFSAMQFMGYSETGKPYMGLGSNLAYRKELFFRNNGFASHLNLKSGDDDLFIGEVANASNTSIEVSPEAKILMNSTSIWKQWKDQRINHISTFSYNKPGTRFRTAIELISRFVFYGLFTTLLILGILQLNIPLMAFAALLFLIRYGIQIHVVNKSAKCFQEMRFYFSIPLYDILIPLLNIRFWIYLLFHKENSYTWRVLH